ncbi:Auxin-responsive protein SAUR61 [Linum perenne]
MKINPKRLLQIAKKWQTIAATRGKTGGRIRITLPKLKILDDHHDDHDEVKKGHFAVYTAVEERKRFRFVLPLSYLEHAVFRELFQKSEEEFGVPCDGPIMVPCDSVFMENAVWRIQKLSPSAEVVKGNKGSFTATTASFSPVASSVRGAGARAFRSRSSLLA